MWSFYLQIGQYITSNGGVVAAEELAPFLDIESAKALKVTFLFFLFASEYVT